MVASCRAAVASTGRRLTVLMLRPSDRVCPSSPSRLLPVVVRFLLHFLLSRTRQLRIITSAIASKTGRWNRPRHARRPCHPANVDKQISKQPRLPPVVEATGKKRRSFGLDLQRKKPVGQAPTWARCVLPCLGDLSLGSLDRAPNPLGRRRQIKMPDPEVGEGIDNGVCHCGQGPCAAGFTAALGA